MNILPVKTFIFFTYLQWVMVLGFVPSYQFFIFIRQTKLKSSPHLDLEVLGCKLQSTFILLYHLWCHAYNSWKKKKKKILVFILGNEIFNWILKKHYVSIQKSTFYRHVTEINGRLNFLPKIAKNRSPRTWNVY